MPRLSREAATKRRCSSSSLVKAWTTLIDDIAQWRPGDPRLPAVADRLVAQLEAVPEEEWKVFAEDNTMSDDLVALLDDWFLRRVPVGADLRRLLEERGWTGWTRLERIRT